ncbi:hypothetical protein K2X33_01335 [bacterium]|nr:hypothetical protein [bacterium]
MRKTVLLTLLAVVSPALSQKCPTFLAGLADYSEELRHLDFALSQNEKQLIAAQPDSAWEEVGQRMGLHPRTVQNLADRLQKEIEEVRMVLQAEKAGYWPIGRNLLSDSDQAVLDALLGGPVPPSLEQRQARRAIHRIGVAAELVLKFKSLSSQKRQRYLSQRRKELEAELTHPSVPELSPIYHVIELNILNYLIYATAENAKELKGMLVIPGALDISHPVSQLTGAIRKFNGE